MARLVRANCSGTCWRRRPEQSPNKAGEGHDDGATERQQLPSAEPGGAILPGVIVSRVPGPGSGTGMRRPSWPPPRLLFETETLCPERKPTFRLALRPIVAKL